MTHAHLKSTYGLRGAAPERVTTYRDLVIKSDPDFVRESREVIEYECTTPAGRGVAEDRTHEGGRRVFRAIEAQRGAYADD